MVNSLLFGLLSLGTATAGGGYYHNHPDVAWNTLETEHFFFHWPESTLPEDDPHYFTTEFTVESLARIAEKSYPEICEQFDYFLSEKTHVTVYDQDRGWEGNGFAIAEWDWTGFAARWGSTYRQRGRMEFLSDVFVHEFAHIVSLKAYLPWSEGTTGFTIGGLVEDEEWFDRWNVRTNQPTNFDLGADILVSAHAPFWWTEGGAEYWSHKAGYNFWGTSRDAFLRMSVLEDRVLDADEWTTRIDKKGFEGERGYNHGYSFGLYLDQRFGEDMMSRMAGIAGERWHLDWDAVVVKATGMDTATLHADWKAWIGAKYEAQSVEVEARGLVQGREIALVEPGWESGDEEWQALSTESQNEAMDGETAYQEGPAWSPDGNYMAWFDQGLNVRKIRPDEWGAVSGSYVDADDKKTLKDYARRTATYDFIDYYRVSWAPDSKRFVATGPEDLFGPLQMETGFSWDGDGTNWNQLAIGTVNDEEKQLSIDWTSIPNTLRATEAAWSPDGEQIAFIRYGDGTHNIWTIRPDGTDASLRTSFRDGTQIQGISYTREGNQLLVSLFRNHMQDLWLYDLGDGSWKRMTESRADETDPIIGLDGRAWFTSDVGGIFNVYSMDLYDGTTIKQTELIGGAYLASPAPGGHLFYTAITGHGFRIRALSAQDRVDEIVDYPGVCGVEAGACADDEAFVSFRPHPVVDAAVESTTYSPVQALMPMGGWPILRTTDHNVEAGGAFYIGDYAEKHWIEGEATFGKDNFFYISYWLDEFWPTILSGYMRYSYKGTYGYGLDTDGVVETTDDITVVDLKFEQVSDDIWTYFTYFPSDALWVGLGADASQYAFRDTGDGADFVPYTQHLGVGAFFEWPPSGGYYWGDQWINPRGDRRLYLDYQYRRTKLVDPEVAGGVYDDGQLLEDYGYHQLLGSYTEFIPIGWFGKTDHHTLQIDLEGGYISRNVMSWDEFIAGGRHPYHWGSGTIGNNVQFSGYEGWSLTGETMVIANMSYRFPLARNMNRKIGPTYTESLYLQFFGTLGNLWSYRVDGDTHVEGYSVVADDPSTIRREIPFKDYAYKNSPSGNPNYLLADLGVELRVRSFIWNDWDWDSFVRVAYGLKATAGYGDVNADMIQSSVARDAASELSDEVEPPTLRIYAGLGTGW